VSSWIEIVVHHREWISIADKDSPAAEVQKVEIFYNCVGAINVPDLGKIPQTEIHIPTRKGVAASYATA